VLAAAAAGFMAVAVGTEVAAIVETQKVRDQLFISRNKLWIPQQPVSHVGK
jgi:hypothetical protein